MKRNLLLPALITAFGLASCGDKKTDSPSTDDDAAQASSTEEIRAAAMAANGVSPEPAQPTGAVIGGAAGAIIGGAAGGVTGEDMVEEAPEYDPAQAEIR